MNTAVKYAAIGLTGLTLFAGTFVGIAAMTGAPLHEVAGLDLFFDAPEGEERTASADTDNSTEPEPSGQELLEANAGLLGAFMMESPFSGTELRDLEKELKSKLREMRVERERLEVRSLELDEREASLVERRSELAEMRTKLEDLENSLDLREAELVRDEASRDEKERQGWKDLAKLYKGGTAEVNATMLAEEDPQDAALILRELGDKQAGEILRLMTPTSVRKKYMDAYRLSEAGTPR